MALVCRIPDWLRALRRDRATRPTPEGVWLERRRVVRDLGLGILAAGTSGWARLATADEKASDGAPGGSDEANDEATRPALGTRFADRFPAPTNPDFAAAGLGGRPVTPEDVAARHNNFYEFTTAKEQVWELARDYRVEPFTLRVHGLVHSPRTFDLDDLFGMELEERLYRFRCVERWAMQVPWTGFPLRRLLDRVQPLGTARWLRIVSLHDPQGLPGQKRQDWYPWPYYEALRLDEAMHDLTLFTVGIYGHALPMQHGAPWRLTVPWKYGFKSPKSIVEIELTADKPGTFWNDQEPEQYGFVSNVEPEVPHPLWSQRFETDIGTGATRETLPYNGYGELVASLYV